MFIDIVVFDLLPYPFIMMSQPRAQSQRWKEIKRSISYIANHFVCFYVLDKIQNIKQMCMNMKNMENWQVKFMMFIVPPKDETIGLSDMCYVR